MDKKSFRKVLTFCAYYYIFNVRTESEMMKMSPRTGRPKTDNPMNERLYVRVTKEEKEEIMEFSSASGFSILEIIRAGIEKLKGQKK
jgi:hypothetical protein